MVAISLLVLWVIGCTCTFLLSVARPVLLNLVHASLHLQNLKNKIENGIESIGLQWTPIGLLLEVLGQEQDTILGAWDLYTDMENAPTNSDLESGTQSPCPQP